MDKHPLLRFFSYSHLPHHLQVVSKPFCELAQQMADPAVLRDGDQRDQTLRKLLEAKDCAVRALL